MTQGKRATSVLPAAGLATRPCARPRAAASWPISRSRSRPSRRPRRALAGCAPAGRGVGARRARIRRARRRSSAAAGRDSRHGVLARSVFGLPGRRRIRRDQDQQLGPVLRRGHRGVDGGWPSRRGGAVRRIAGGEAGIRTGDVIASIDGVAVNTTTLADTIGRMRGKEGTSVKIGILREGIDGTAAIHPEALARRIAQRELRAAGARLRLRAHRAIQRNHRARK